MEIYVLFPIEIHMADVVAHFGTAKISKTRENHFVISSDVSPEIVNSNKFKMKSLTTQNWSLK